MNNRQAAFIAAASFLGGLYNGDGDDVDADDIAELAKKLANKMDFQDQQAWARGG
jgi:hypothetical protein